VKFYGTDTIRVIFEIGAFLDLAKVPHFDCAIISARDESGFQLVEPNHPYA